MSYRQKFYTSFILTLIVVVPIYDAAIFVIRDYVAALLRR